jgi:hypothetical protein
MRKGHVIFLLSLLVVTWSMEVGHAATCKNPQSKKLRSTILAAQPEAGSVPEATRVRLVGGKQIEPRPPATSRRPSSHSGSSPPLSPAMPIGTQPTPAPAPTSNTLNETFVGVVAVSALPPGNFRAGAAATHLKHVGSFVVGIEGDFTSSTSAARPDCTPQYCPAEARWTASGSGVVGYTLYRVMPYATAGAAMARFTDSSSGAGFTRAGWTAGAGMRVRVTDRWVGKLEYRHEHYGSARAAYGEYRLDKNGIRLGLQYNLTPPATAR